MLGPTFKVRHRGVEWTMTALTVAGTWITAQVHDRSVNMPSSVLEFSLWDATGKQIPDMVLSADAVEELRPWLMKVNCRWRLGWHRPKTKTAEPKTDPRQLKLFKE
jgi:hypothetical protein